MYAGFAFVDLFCWLNWPGFPLYLGHFFSLAALELIMKNELLGLGAMLVLAATGADAELYPIATHGFWTTSVQHEGGEFYCRMDNRATAQPGEPWTAITTDAEGTIVVGLFDSLPSSWVDSVGVGHWWTPTERARTILGGVNSGSAYLGYLRTQTNQAEAAAYGQFIRAFAYDETMYFDLNLDGSYEVWYSLAGSAAAVVDFLECSATLYQGDS